MLSRDVRYETDMEKRAEKRVTGALAALLRRQKVSIAARLAEHNAVLVPMVLYGSEIRIADEK